MSATDALRLLAAVAAPGSFTGAAARLNHTQSAVSDASRRWSSRRAARSPAGSPAAYAGTRSDTPCTGTP
ncbi:LysR family transcriptional regulator [Streptomyces flavidovirens]|uniref:helix-turn-helix domain-containing protein n=1 Tax=Streptomyces flavidovirens TaxID=67298 RepID=UPI0036D19127